MFHARIDRRRAAHPKDVLQGLRGAKDAGLARESLYRSLGAGGNPEFATVFKVLSSMGLRLIVGKATGDGRDGRS